MVFSGRTNGKNKMFKITPILCSELPPSSSSVGQDFSLIPSLYSIQTGIFDFPQKNTRTDLEPKSTVGCRHQPQFPHASTQTSSPQDGLFSLPD